MAIFEKISKIAQEVALTQGAHIPTLIVIGKQGSTAVQFPGQAETHHERATLMKVIGFDLAFNRHLGALKQVCLINEGWVSVGSDETAPKVIPSKDPNRKEALIVVMIDLQENQTRMLLFEMIRDAEGKLTDLPRMDIGPPDIEIRAYLLEKFVAGYQKAREHRKEN